VLLFLANHSAAKHPAICQFRKIPGLTNGWLSSKV
jgi:hypothetical protein